MTLNWVPLTECDNRKAGSAGQDQTARMCRLILPYTFRKIYPWSRTAALGLNFLLEGRTMLNTRIQDRLLVM